MADATGVCYTQSGDVKRYEEDQFWKPNDYCRLSKYDSGSNPPNDPSPSTQYSLDFTKRLSYGPKNEDGSYQYINIKCDAIGDDVKIYDSFPTPPSETSTYTYTYTGVRVKYGDIVKWYVGFSMHSKVFYVQFTFFNASGEINNKTLASGTKYECPDYLQFGLNTYSRNTEVYFYKYSRGNEQMVFTNVNMYFQLQNGTKVATSSKSITCDVSKVEYQPYEHVGTFSAFVNNKGNLSISITSSDWDSNCLIYNNQKCNAVIEADQFPNGFIVDCYYA